MLKKTIKYTDLNGQETEEDAYFNLTKAECIELNIRNDLEVVSRGRNNNEIMDAFKRVIKASYGVRTGDGKFIKDDRDFQNFMASEVYSELFMEIFTNPSYAAEFIRAILPAEIQLEEGLTNSQGNVPTGLQSHPSMQGYKAPQASQTPAKTLPTEMTPAVQPDSLGENDVEYQEYLAEKRAREAAATPPAQVSPEVPQASSPPREELI